MADHDLAPLFDVSKASRKAGLQDYLRGILEGCASWFGASGTSVFIRHDASDSFLLAAKTGADSTVPDEASFRVGHGIAGAAIDAGKPMLVQDPQDNPLLTGRVQPRHEIGSAMIVPLITAESGCIGVLNVSRRIGEPPLSHSDLAQAAPLARHIALAVENARLFAAMDEAISQTSRANEKLDAIISCLGVGILVADAEGSIEQWNPEAEAIVGHRIPRRAQLLKTLSSCPAPLRRGAAKAFRQALRGKRSVERAQDEETQQAWSVVASPLPRGGATIAIQDLTEQEKALKELDRVKRLAEIGQLTAAIAHEIRNPLTGIRSAAQIVQSAPGELAEFGKIIEREALKLNALCDDFLDFARPLNLVLDRLDLVDILQRVCSEYQAMAHKHQVRLRLVIDGSKAPKVKGDQMRVEQVCRNLILNGIQASRQNGNVTVSLIRGVLVVEDEGQGIESEVVGKLFTPFFTTKANGTGLGLSNVRKIVDAHGWQISVSTQPGMGTRFEIRFQQKKAA